MARKYHLSKNELKDAKFIFKHQYSSDLWPTKDKRNCKMRIVDKSLKIIKLVKNSVRLILGNFRIVGYPFFGRMPMDSSHSSLCFEAF